MKRVLSIFLAFCLLPCLTAAGLAEAEPPQPLRVLDGWQAAKAYQEKYPHRAVETLERFDQQGGDQQESILLSGQWDAACVDTDDFSLSALDALGLTLDLGGVPELAALAEDLYPSIRKGCSAGDKLVALPAGYIGTRACSYRLLGIDYNGNEDAQAAAIRDRLGFTAADQPTTFAEVCQLGLRYMALDRETRRGTAFLFSDTAPQGFALLYNLIQTYQTEATDETGAIRFDTPAFRAALQATEPLLAAFAADPKRTYSANGELNVVLCDDIGVTQCYGGFMKVTEGEAIPALMTVVLVNPQSPRLSEAIDFALAAAACGTGELPLLFYQNADYDALLVKSYDATIAAQKEEHEAQAVIDQLEALKAAGDDRYFLPKRVLEHYAAEIQPRLVFQRWFTFYIDDIINRYLSGKLDGEGMIAALNEAAMKER